MTPLLLLVLASVGTGSPLAYTYSTYRAPLRPSLSPLAWNPQMMRYGQPIIRSYIPQRTYYGQVSNQDVFQQTKSLADSLTPSLRALANDPRSAAIANKYIQENYLSCVSSLDDGINSIQTATELLESARPKITAFTDKIDSFTKLRDPVEIVRETGAMLRLMKPLLEDSQSVDLDKCQAQAGAAYPFNNNGIPAFIGQLRSVSSRLENICSQGEFNRDSITAIGDIMDIVADLYRSVGDVQTGEKIRGGKTFTHRLMAQLQKIDFKGLGVTGCSTEGDLSSAADIMDDLATLIEDTGIENIEEQLGVDLSYAFNLQPSAPVYYGYKY